MSLQVRAAWVEMRSPGDASPDGEIALPPGLAYEVLFSEVSK